MSARCRHGQLDQMLSRANMGGAPDLQATRRMTCTQAPDEVHCDATRTADYVKAD